MYSSLWGFVVIGRQEERTCSRKQSKKIEKEAEIKSVHGDISVIKVQRYNHARFSVLFATTGTKPVWGRHSPFFTPHTAIATVFTWELKLHCQL